VHTNRPGGTDARPLCVRGHRNMTVYSATRRHTPFRRWWQVLCLGFTDCSLRPSRPPLTSAYVVRGAIPGCRPSSAFGGARIPGFCGHGRGRQRPRTGRWKRLHRPYVRPFSFDLTFQDSRSLSSSPSSPVSDSVADSAGTRMLHWMPDVGAGDHLLELAGAVEDREDTGGMVSVIT